jgi:hypothetical protein
MLPKYNLEYNKRKLEIVFLLGGILVACIVIYLMTIQHGRIGF